MPYFWSRSLVGVALAVLTVVCAVAPSRAQALRGFGYSGAWGYYAALPVYYAFPFAVAAPGQPRNTAWQIGGLNGAVGRLALH